MGDKTHIPYVDASWNFLRGCTRKSLGCVNCYAAHISARFSKPGEPYDGLAEFRDGKPQWSGEVRLIEKHLDDPLKWKKSRVMFVNSMSDTFHESVPDEWLDEAFDNMERCPDHTFLLFTKRTERMKMYLANRYPDGVPEHIWPGTTVEHNDYRFRAQILAEIPAAVRFLSCEPLLGDLDLENFLERRSPRVPPGEYRPNQWKRERLIDWVMVGGESGSHARPVNPWWVRHIRQQCEKAGAAFWFKQWGEYAPYFKSPLHQLVDKYEMLKVGTKAAGNMLDGKVYEERPTPRVAHFIFSSIT